MADTSPFMRQRCSAGSPDESRFFALETMSCGGIQGQIAPLLWLFLRIAASPRLRVGALHHVGRPSAVLLNTVAWESRHLSVSRPPPDTRPAPCPHPPAPAPVCRPHSSDLEGESVLPRGQTPFQVATPGGPPCGSALSREIASQLLIPPRWRLHVLVVPLVQLFPHRVHRLAATQRQP